MGTLNNSRRRIPMKPIRLATLALVVAAFGCSTLEISTDYAPGTDFSKYKTFTIKQGEAAKNQIAADRVRAALTSTLEAKGFKSAPDGGDLSVFGHFKGGKETQLNTTGYGYGGWGGWRYGGGYGGMQTTTVTEIPTGTIVIDLVDSKSNTAVWRGIAKDQISTSATPEEREQKVREVFTKLFENFPPK
jgi:hypothetical protein